MTDLRPESIAAWTRLTTISRVLLEEVEAALKSAGFPALSWYDVLLELEKASSDGLRPFEIRDRLLLPQYGTSRLLDRLVQAGLLEKAECPDDGRGQIIRITPAGRDLRRRMWPVYAEVLARRLDARLTKAEAGELARLLNRLSTRAGSP